MHRFFVEERIPGIGAVVALSKEESVHAARVLRLREGDAVCLLDGENLFAGQLADLTEQSVQVRVTELLPSPEPSVEMTLMQGLPKGDKLELIIQKATELGIWEIALVEMERSVAKADKQGKKLERYRRIALEAAKQSGRAHVPGITERSSLSMLSAYDSVFVAWEEEKSLPLSLAVSREKANWKTSPARIALVIGPEGGISPREIDQLKALGAVSVSLGKRILRTETAGLCALSVIWAALGEM